MHELLNKKHTGILLPLFSVSSRSDFGCGDTATLMEWIDFVKEMNFDIIQLLPINEMPPETNCPYTSLTAFAMDPIYISIKDIENLDPEITKKIKSKDFNQEIKNIKKKEYIPYGEIKRIKFELLWRQYNYFHKNFINSNEYKNFEDYKHRNKWWLRDYAIFRRLKDNYNWRSWLDWEEAIKNRNLNKLDAIEKDELFYIDFFKYIQWEMDKQFNKIREKLKEKNIKLLGDIPFMVNQESSDVWSRQEDFRLDLEAGAPPDAFTKEGQKWGIPAPNWRTQISNNFEWWRLKIKKFEDVYDMVRIDHMVGFFRTWVIPKDKNLKADFDILDPIQQEERGRIFLKTIINSTKMLVVAEDLGVIPDYVRKVLKELNVSGYKVMRWEKEKDEYIDPKNYYPISLATTSTHDTEPMKTWWRIIDKKEKRLFLKMLYLKDIKKPPKNYEEIKEIVNYKILNSASRLVILSIQDIIAGEDRINLPGTSERHNWSWRIKSNWQKFYEKHKNDFDNIKKEIKKRNEEKPDDIV